MTGFGLSRSGTMPILDVESMLQRLPARLRAELAWVRKPIRDAVDRIATEPVDPTLLEEVAQKASEPLFRVGATFSRALAESPEEWRAAILQQLEDGRSRLLAFLHDAEAIDTLNWVLGFLRSMFTAGLSTASLSELTEQVERDMRELAESSPGRQLTGAQLALMAAAKVANEQGSSAHAHDLLDLSFLNLIQVQAELRRAGYYVAAFPEETTAERRARTLAYAQFVRDGLTDEEGQVLSNARLQNLR